ncbi:MAG: response regulator [Solirubrobacterales bacterium]
MFGKQQSVLVVDDHPAFRASVRRLLESEGYSVIGEAGDGIAAVHAAGQLQPDVVLLDIQLPDIDGFEVADRIEAAASDDGPAIVLVSSRDRSDFGPLLDSSRVRGFVSKAELTGEALSEMLR